MQDVWAIWVDVNHWMQWDKGIAHAEIRENFQVGNAFSLTPQGGEPIQVHLKTVTQGEEFSDEAVLPFGVIRNVHCMQMLGKKLQLTHEVHAEIKEEAAGFFGKEIWPHMQSGLPESVNNIIALVQAQ
ncbi:polyketide cyclase [Verminephrobacter aporrectodeae subsp. tuberculatae]|nr:polyketide cyclase [Verminephrobacter aporrectodeae]MCW5256507.1 polyketide cyclase [Verminephrobacter aporrectodeae subsp. tuberculatae]